MEIKNIDSAKKIFFTVSLLIASYPLICSRTIWGQCQIFHIDPYVSFHCAAFVFITCNLKLWTHYLGLAFSWISLLNILWSTFVIRLSSKWKRSFKLTSALVCFSRFYLTVSDAVLNFTQLWLSLLDSHHFI